MNNKCLSKKNFFHSIWFVFFSATFRTLYATEPRSFLDLFRVVPDTVNSAEIGSQPESISIQIRKRLERGIGLLVIYNVIQESYEEIFNQTIDLPIEAISKVIELPDYSKNVFDELPFLWQRQNEIMNYTSESFSVEGLIRTKNLFTYFDWLDKKEAYLLSMIENPLYARIVPDLLETHREEIDITYKEICDEKLNNIRFMRNNLTEEEVTEEEEAINDESTICIGGIAGTVKFYKIKSILCALADISYNHFKSYDQAQQIFAEFEEVDPIYDNVFTVSFSSRYNNSNIKKIIQYFAESTYISPLHFKHFCEKSLNEWKNLDNERLVDSLDQEIEHQAFVITGKVLKKNYFKDIYSYMLNSFLEDSVLKNFHPTIKENAWLNHYDKIHSVELNNESKEDAILYHLIDELSTYLALKTLHHYLADLLKKEPSIDRSNFLSSIYYYRKKDGKIDENIYDRTKIIEIAGKPDTFPAAASSLRNNLQHYSSKVIINPFYLKILCYDSLDKIIESRCIPNDLLQRSAKMAKKNLQDDFFFHYDSNLLKKALHEEMLFFSNKKGWINFFEKKINKRLLNSPNKQILKNDTLEIEWKTFHDSIKPNIEQLYRSAGSHFEELKKKFNSTEKDSEYQKAIKNYHLNKFKLEAEKKCVLMNIVQQGVNLNIPDSKIFFQSIFFTPEQLKKCLGKKIYDQIEDNGSTKSHNSHTFDAIYTKALSEMEHEFIIDNKLGSLEHDLTEWAHSVCNLQNLNLTQTRDQLLRIILMHINTHQLCSLVTPKTVLPEETNEDLKKGVQVIFDEICVESANSRDSFMRPAKNMKTILGALPTTIQFMESYKLLKKLITKIIKNRNDSIKTTSKRDFDQKWRQTEEKALNEIKKEVNEYFSYALKEEKFSSEAVCWDIKKTIQDLVQERKEWLKLEEQVFLGRITPEQFEEEKKNYSKLHDYRDYDHDSAKDEKRFSTPKNYVGVTLTSIHQPPSVIQRVQRWFISLYYYLF